MTSRQFTLHSVLLGFSLISVQGSIYLLQIFGAQFLISRDFNTIRITESLAATCSLLISAGMPSVALVWGEKTGQIHGKLRMIGIGSATMLALLLVLYLANAVGVTDLVDPREAKGHNPWSMPHFAMLAGLMSFRLLLSAMLQSHQRYIALAGGAAIACLAGLFAGAILLWSTGDGVLAWLGARYTLEGVACLAFLVLELKPARDRPPVPAESFRARELVLAAAPVGIGVGLRALVEHGPLLMLTALGASELVLAQIGVIVTVMTVSFIFIGIVQGVLVPLLARSTTLSTLRAAALPAGGAVLGSVAILGVLCGVLEATSNHAPFDNLSIVLIAAAAVAAKSIASFSGGLLLVLGRMKLIMGLNVSVVLVMIIIMFFTQSKVSTVEALGLILSVEAFGAAVYLAACFFVGGIRRDFPWNNS